MRFKVSCGCMRLLRRSGVTLVELLVVIAIIGLLVELAKAARKAEVGVTRVLKGGYELEWHWNEGAATAAIESEDFDFVVLQERRKAALDAGPELALHSDDGNHSAPAGAIHSVNSNSPQNRDRALCAWL